MPVFRKFIFFLFFTVSMVGVLLFKPLFFVSADEIGDLQTEINKLEELKKLSENATTPLEKEVATLDARINSAKAGIAKAKVQAQELAASIEKRETDLVYHYQIFSNRVAESYKRERTFNPLVLFLSSQSASQLTKDLAYQESARAQDDRLIRSLSEEIGKLSEDKKKLESDQVHLAALSEQLDKQADFFKGEIVKAKAYQGELSGEIAELSAKQQEIINAKNGGFTVNVGDSELADDYNASIKGFRDSAPSGSFAVFSIGAWTHRNGMSQYGALGRVKSNSKTTYEDLLKHYYPGVKIEKVNTDVSIKVNGTNSYGQNFNNENYKLEEYLKHIYEIPASWPKEVLKAQAIAARSYAYGKSSICPGQSCQEFKKELNGSAWQEAVKETEGKIMTGGPGSYQYSSTTGGWINGGVGWDTTDGKGGSNFIDRTYEKIAGSPWVYKAWYTKTYRNNSEKCGRSNPWLTNEEMSDIVNAAIVLSKGNDDRITPVTTSCWGGNPYSHEELRSKGGVTNVSSVSVSQGNGTTSKVVFQTNKGTKEFSGDAFKQAFTLRAPAYLSIKQKGFAFFNIEKK